MHMCIWKRLTIVLLLAKFSNCQYQYYYGAIVQPPTRFVTRFTNMDQQAIALDISTSASTSSNSFSIQQTDSSSTSATTLIEMIERASQPQPEFDMAHNSTPLQRSSSSTTSNDDEIEDNKSQAINVDGFEPTSPQTTTNNSSASFYAFGFINRLIERFIVRLRDLFSQRSFF